jgi:hypothetical protein
MTLVAFQVEGDAAAISAAMETVRAELARVMGGGEAAQISARAPQANGSTLPSPAKEGASGREKRQAGKPVAFSDSNGKKEPRAESFEAKALEMIRNSHQGVTSEEIYKEVGCTSIQSVYQLCLALQKKGLVMRLDSGAWKAVNG